jgi:hypothetical protein
MTQVVGMSLGAGMMNRGWDPSLLNQASSLLMNKNEAAQFQSGIGYANMINQAEQAKMSSAASSRAGGSANSSAGGLQCPYGSFTNSDGVLLCTPKPCDPGCTDYGLTPQGARQCSCPSR